MTGHPEALPLFADTVVIGAGTAGAALAGVLAERGDQSVLLLEAGPDYGAYDSGRWPEALLDARALPTASHDWGFDRVGGLIFAGTPDLEGRMREFAASSWLPEEQTIAKARSARCPRGFDLHLFPTGGPDPDGNGWRWIVPFACMTPRSRGAVELTGADPAAPLRIDHNYLSDPDGEDRRVLLDGLELARAFTAQPALASLLGDEMLPGAAMRAREDLAALLTSFCMHYDHPVGTCRMGPVHEPDAVVDARGRVHGLDNAYVADGSVIPVIPRANTNMPALVVALRIAQWL